MEQFNIFGVLYDEYKIKKPIKLIECFGGYGSQALALKYLGANFQHHKLIEWALPSIIIYASVHRNELQEYGNNFCGDLTKDQIAKLLFEMGVSLDYSKPATLEQLKRVKEDKLRLCYNSIMWSNNLVDISRVKGEELKVEDTENFTYLLTYSFPCQDLSLAGKGAGMEKGSGTRSGLLWEVERILSECENKPQVLLMENVTQVHGAGNAEHFKKWMLRLEEMGYQSYWEDMSAVDYGIPQTRNRTFMISILGDYSYNFPKKEKLNLRLKDLLEKEVDEKYYLSEKMINYISATGGGGITTKIQESILKLQDHLQPSQIKEQEQQIIYQGGCPEEYDLSKPSFKEVYDKMKKSSFQQQQQRIQENEVCGTLLARDYKDPKLVIEKGENNKSLKETLKKIEIENVDEVAYLDSYNRNTITDGTAKTILTGVDFRNHDFILIKNATKKGYLEAEDGDGVDISSRMESHRGTVQKDKAQTITTMGGENVGVIVKDTNYSEKSIEKILNNIVEEEGISGSLTATGMQSINHDGCQLIKVIGNYSPSNHNASRIIDTGGVAPTVMENHGTITAIVEKNKNGK